MSPKAGKAATKPAAAKPAAPTAAAESHIAFVNGRWGKCYYFRQDAYIGQSLLNYGEYNPDETECIVALAAKAGRDKLVLDIGANIGVISQALEYHGFKVEAFEPQREVHALLKKNIQGPAHNVALGAAAGSATMPKVDYAKPNNFGGIAIGMASAEGTIEVELRTLDSYNFQNVGVIKIDVEGFEEQVLRGGVETIQRCKPFLYLEDDRADKSASLHKYLKELGYQFQAHNPALYRENNFFAQKVNVWGKNFVSKNIVCVKAA